MQQVHVLAPAKLNWALEIKAKRPDGYHEIDTIFQALNWHDELHLVPLAESVCRIHCDWPGVPTDETNLIARAWDLLQRRYPAKRRGVSCSLIKRIPPGGGLGGGSSNAAAMLIGLNRLWNLRLTHPQLTELAALLGSDCAFFIHGGTMRARGRGEQLETIPNNLNDCWLVVVCPDFPSSTAGAYSHVRAKHFTNGEYVKLASECLEKGDLQKLQRCIYNIFTRIVFETLPHYKEVLAQIDKAGLVSPLLAGSGSSIFTFAQHREHAKTALNIIQHLYPTSFIARPDPHGAHVSGLEVKASGGEAHNHDGPDPHHYLPGVSQPE